MADEQPNTSSPPRTIGSERDESQRIQQKQGGHHLPPRDDSPAMDDTDRNTDRIIKPSRIHKS